jgi:hypothetical protein
MDLHSHTPQDSQRLLEISLNSGLLRRSDGTLTPSFEISDDTVELDYKPPRDLILAEQQKDQKDFFIELVDRISASSGLQRKEIIAKINKMRERMPVDIEVAALIVGRDLGVDISEDIRNVREQLLAK